MRANIRIETAPTATAATTAARLIVRHPSLSTITTDLLNLLIGEATGHAEDYIGRSLARTTYRELLTGSGTEILRLARGPLESVTSIAIDGTAIESTTYSRVDQLQQNLRRLGGGLGNYAIWPLARQAVGSVEATAIGGANALLNIEAVYTAGYWLPSMSGMAPVGSIPLPPALEGAIQRIVLDCRRYEELPVGVASIKKGDREIRYVELGSTGIMVSPSVIATLDREAAVYG
jgi:hypothetical protein